MNADPVILILEDERLQLLTLRSQLAGIGRLAEFTDPVPALEFARTHRCDAAIVDIRMPRRSMDGLEFLRGLREFDKSIAVIVRTADESEKIADGAIEFRATKRAIKSKTTVAELQQATTRAISETRQSRGIAAAAKETDAAKARLADALGDHNLRLAAADVNRGLIQKMRGELTGLSSLVSMIRQQASMTEHLMFIRSAERASDLVSGMVESINVFLDGPFGISDGMPQAPVNQCLGALRQFFHAEGRWAAQKKKITIRQLNDEVHVACKPLALTNGLRHLVEYFLLRLPQNSEASLGADLLASEAAMSDHLSRATVVLNRNAFLRSHPCVSFRATGDLGENTLSDVSDIFAFGSPDGQTGSLPILGEVVSAAQGAILLTRLSANAFAIEAVIPIAT